MHLPALQAITLVLLSSLSAVSGALVKHDWVITWESGAPNGQERDMILINGNFPGPALLCDEDDDIEITVHNRMPFNTSVHWHGLMMQGTPWSDGSPGLSQKPIEPDQGFIYRFKASPAGTHWYHSHSRTTLLDGLYGSIYIRPKVDAPAPWALISNDSADIAAIKRAVMDPKLMLVSDWSRFKSWEYMEAEESSGLAIFCVDSILLNGKGSVFCPSVDYLINETSTYMKYGLYPRQVNDKGCFPMMKSTQGPYLWKGKPETIPFHLQEGCIPADGPQEVIEVEPEAGWISLNFIGAATFKTIVFSVDQHQMWVYEVDGHYIEPQLVDTVHMYAGERYSVMIKLDQSAQDYTIRVADNCLTQVISAYATLRYRGGVMNGQTTGVITYGGQNNTPVVTLDRDHLPPYPANPPARKGDAMHVLQTHRWGTAWQYTMSGGGMYQEDRSAYEPLLYDPHSADAMNESLVIRTKNGSWVDFVIQVGSLPGQPQEFPHLMHKHTGKMWLIGEGEGIWNYSSVEEAIDAESSRFNLENPNWRDTYITSFDGPSWLVLRYQVTNPGPWLFHCHIETHLAGGMAVAILDGIDAWPSIPPEYGPDQRGYLPSSLPELESGHPEDSVAKQCPVSIHKHKHSHSPAQASVGDVPKGKYWNTLILKMIDFLESIMSDPSS
ncbi:Glc7p regulatory subunit [Conoideocrella luteorostrata]|uniref:Glc7p regulatory subunit n=1 Tax=Conoideocrella luteorostrata TaxID=1105319 RepID=A0AAJ0D1C6_9HYPO|nr:Glc7p regulatory subunit [Conoideocrella luteorostrata]